MKKEKTAKLKDRKNIRALSCVALIFLILNFLYFPITIPCAYADEYDDWYSGYDEYGGYYDDYGGYTDVYGYYYDTYDGSYLWNWNDSSSADSGSGNYYIDAVALAEEDNPYSDFYVNPETGVQGPDYSAADGYGGSYDYSYDYPEIDYDSFINAGTDYSDSALNYVNNSFDFNQYDNLIDANSLTDINGDYSSYNQPNENKK